jgi:transposase
MFMVRTVLQRLRKEGKQEGFRRFLKIGDSHFAIDPERVAAAAKFDGIYVIRTNARISPLVVALRYRERWIVEDIFRTAKSIIDTRPIFHQRDDTIRGHVFCSFLALLLRKELIDRLVAAGRQFEWADIIRDLDQIVQTDIDQAGRRLRLRAAGPGCAGAVFQAVGVALPPMIQVAAPTHP